MALPFTFKKPKTYILLTPLVYLILSQVTTLLVNAAQITLRHSLRYQGLKGKKKKGYAQRL